MSPRFSIIVPVRDGGPAFRTCLGALARRRRPDDELLVVDDGSTDGSAEAAAGAGARVLRTAGGAGPAAARNLGAAEARSEWLLFLDADCEVGPDTLDRLRAALADDPVLGAAFGSYDDDPPAPGLISQYRNLLHHWTHQRWAGDAETFWAGCGTVRRQAFVTVGGFDADRFPRPSIEDIELGFRLRAAGHRIRLLPEVQVKHHKRWSFAGMLRTDLRDRALPWARLGLERGGLGASLNVDRRGRASGAASLVLVGAAPAAVLWPVAGACLAATAATFLFAANRDFYGLLARRQGAWSAARAVPLHWLYFAYSSVAYAWAVTGHLLRRAPRAGAAGAAGRRGAAL